MHFSDGTPLTATDFAYSINRALDPHLCDKLDKDTYGPHTRRDGILLPDSAGLFGPHRRRGGV